jgi:hypothetical protein
MGRYPWPVSNRPTLYTPPRDSSALFFLWLGLGRGARESLARGGFDNDGKPDLVLSTGSNVLTYPQAPQPRPVRQRWA